MGKFVGIDLGTTYSVVAYINANGKPEIIPNNYGRSVTPSVIYFNGGKPIVGDEAKEHQASGEVDVASFFKRNMGNSQFQLTFYGQEYNPVDLSALVLEYLKEQAEAFFGEAVTDAVITVPAYFKNTQRVQTIEAGQKAGLNVLKIISEPTAAALAYGLRPNPHNQEQKVLVYDLGGGTFDISLVSINATDLQVLGTDGDDNLGGKDWDDRLITYLATAFEQEFGLDLVGEDINELRVQAEKLKHSLSTKFSADIRVQAAGQVGIYTVTREIFENLTRDLMERTQLLTEQVLREAKLSWHELSGVLPVGGSTKMPMVVEYVKRMSGKPPMSGINPDEAVGMGAAIQAAMEIEQRAGVSQPKLFLAGRKTTTDVIAHSLGLIVESADRSRYRNDVLIRKNISIPVVQQRPYQMMMRRGGNTELEVFLTQSESDDPQQCVYLGRYVFSNFAPTKEKTTILDVSYEYDKNGTVHVVAVEQATGRPLTLTVHPVPPDVPVRFLQRPCDVKVREPLHVYLAFDVSGSMNGRPIAEAKKAAEKFVSQCDLETTSVGLIAFSDRVNVDQPATQDRKAISSAISRLSSGSTGYGNDTDPFDTIRSLFANVSGLRYAIVLADGVWSYQEDAVTRARRCHEDGIEVIAIGFGGADKKFLN